MSVLVGLYPPTSGSAFINDYDITTNLEGARRSLGLCPQFDILFDMLTIEEHIYFFSRLKGSTWGVIIVCVPLRLIGVALQTSRRRLTRL